MDIYVYMQALIIMELHVAFLKQECTHHYKNFISFCRYKNYTYAHLRYKYLHYFVFTGLRKKCRLLQALGYCLHTNFQEKVNYS